MQIETFRVFRDLVETTSFSKAAEANGITQSAVSQQVRAIEKRFRVRLIERGKRYFSLTPEGRAFLNASREILSAYDNLDNRIQAITHVIAGELRVATVLSIGLHELPPCLHAFRKSHPKVDVKVDYCRSNEVYEAVLSGRAEVGLVAYPGRKRGLKVLPFWKDQLILACAPSHRFAKRGRKVRLTELAGEKFVAFEPDLPTRKEIDRRLKEQGVRLRPILEFDNVETVKRAVGIEGAVSIVPGICVRNEVASGQLVALELDEPDMSRPLGALIQTSAVGSPALKEFLELLEKTDLGAV